jgi:DNA mismatch endonuclease, patch repair protein
MPTISRTHRSRMMAAVRSKHTGPELRVRRALYALGERFRLHRRDLPGTPDIVLPRHRLALFVHGCFWHQHPGCRSATRPAVRQRYWGPKLGRNVERDLKAESSLRALGWKVGVIWECETRRADDLVNHLKSLVCQSTSRSGN